MVEFDRRSARYRLGLKIFRLGSVASKSVELVRQADPLLWNLTEETDESSFLQVADGNEALCLRRFDGTQNVRVLFLEAGKRSASTAARASASFSLTCPSGAGTKW